MIGFIYVSDIPKFIIMMAIAIALVLIWVPALAYFFPHGGTAAGWLGLAALAGTSSFSWWAGTAIWDRIELNLALWGDKHREKRMANCYTCQCAPEQKRDTNWYVWYECPRCGRRGKGYHMVFDSNATRNAIVSWEETIKTASATITKK